MKPKFLSGQIDGPVIAAKINRILSVKLTILGSGSAVPTLLRNVTAQYLNLDERRILIDCGEGTQIQLRRFKVKFQRLQYIFISHLHGDHFLGIFGLLSSMSLTGRTNPLTIYCPRGLKELIELQFKISGVHLSYELIFFELNCNTKELIIEDNVMEVYAFPVKHRVNTYGFLFCQKEKERSIDKLQITKHRLTIQEIHQLKAGEDIIRNGQTIPNSVLTIAPVQPKKYAYSSDTAFLPKICEWIEGADLLYHEATFADKDSVRAKSTMHSTAKQAATIARDAHVKKLLLGHFSARYKNTDILLNEARIIFPNTFCVTDGDDFIL